MSGTARWLVPTILTVPSAAVTFVAYSLWRRAKDAEKSLMPRRLATALRDAERRVLRLKMSSGKREPGDVEECLIREMGGVRFDDDLARIRKLRSEEAQRAAPGETEVTMYIPSMTLPEPGSDPDAETARLFLALGAESNLAVRETRIVALAAALLWVIWLLAIIIL